MLFALAVVCVFGGTAAYLYREQSRALSGSAFDAQIGPDGRLRPLAEIRDALRSMKLVTTELRGEMTSAFESRIWRGNASASVAAPVVYHYGVDLSRLEVLHLGTSWLSGVYIVSVPTPERIAVEVDIDHRREDVNVSGLRLRSRVGEYLLGRARVGVQSQARAAALTAEQEARVRADAAAQVEALVKSVVGAAARVQVRFASDDAPAEAVAPVPDAGSAAVAAVSASRTHFAGGEIAGSAPLRPAVARGDWRGR